MSFLAWIAIAVIFLILEIASFSFFYGCFVLGAILAAVSTFFTDSVTLQGLIFMILSVVLLPLSRPLARKLIGEMPDTRRA
jgi:membrane protein implicated in regulation of membrane protease activity